MHEKILSVFMLKKSIVNKIKYFKCSKFEIKLKKTTSLFVSFFTFDPTN
jgi:hypothetical protein